MDLKNYEADFLTPGMPDTGKPVEELKQRVLEMFEEGKDLSRRMLKLEVFEYLLDNMRLGSAPDDFFPAFGLWGNKPYDELILHKNYAAKRAEIAFPEDVSSSSIRASSAVSSKFASAVTDASICAASSNAASPFGCMVGISRASAAASDSIFSAWSMPCFL